ncbi:MAG: hypothetical protein II103_02485, partial [Treponema sp.]|nr:hypothetical protein [Treponema sp.]
LLSPDFYQIMREAQWLKDKRLETELLAMKDADLKSFDIDEEVDSDFAIPEKSTEGFFLVIRPIGRAA